MKRPICWAFILILTISGCFLRDRDEIPDPLLGSWETDAPQYRGCSFTVTGETITFDNGAGHVDINYIKSVTIKPQTDSTVFQIRYENRNEAEFKLSLHYREQDGGAAIRFGNQMDIVWRKRQAET